MISQQGTSRKVYILASIEPHVDVSGDIWYKNGDLDKEFIDTLHAACAKYLALKVRITSTRIEIQEEIWYRPWFLFFSKGSATVPELTDHIKKSGLSKVKKDNNSWCPSVERHAEWIESIQHPIHHRRHDLRRKSRAHTWLGENLLPLSSSLFSREPQAYYRLTNLEVKHNGFTMMPCGTCPVRRRDRAEKSDWRRCSMSARTKETSARELASISRDGWDWSRAQKPSEM